MTPSPTLRAAVVGSGYMGGGIAQVMADAGHVVFLADIDAATAAASRKRLVAQARAYEDAGLFPEGSGDRIDSRLLAAKSIEGAVADAQYVTEAVPEAVDIKRDALQRISAASPPGCIIASNTSSLSIEQLAVGVTYPSRFLGVHWMNPAPFIPGVEIIPGSMTQRTVVDHVERLLRSLNKVTVRVADTPGFVSNRLQFALFKEAVRILEERVATAEQIDDVVSSMFGYRLALLGPFAIADMAGLDVYDSSYRSLERALGERFASPAALAELVASGNLGFKSGQGFLDIADDDRPALVAYRDRAYALLAQLRVELGPAPGR